MKGKSILLLIMISVAALSHAKGKTLSDISDNPEVYLPVEIGAGIAAAGALTALTVIGVGLSTVVPRSLKPLLVNIGTAGTVAAIGGGLLAVGGVTLGALEWAEGGIEDLF